MPLADARSVKLLSHETILDLTNLLEEVREATVIHTVPSLMRQMLGRMKELGVDGRSCQKLRMIFIGGDAVPPELLEQMQEVFRGVEIRVLYGPTEATVICMSYRVEAGPRVRRQIIGRPLSNMRIRLRDRRGHLPAVGVAGEICIGGAGVTRGYRGDTNEENAERYLMIEGERYYRTGDLGRYLPDGNLEFLGRIDEQVKIRGFRIEPGEIEAALLSHPEVAQAIVVAREDKSGDRQLVGYVIRRLTEAEHEQSQVHCWSEVERSAEAPTAYYRKDGDTPIQSRDDGKLGQVLQNYLRKSLPDYMAPAAIMTVGAFPLTPNGKLDRNALPEPEFTISGNSRRPRTPQEEILCELFAEVLQLERVGIDDNFFDLGGHSLLATRLISRVRSTLGMEVAIRALFETGTVAELAKRLRESGSARPALRTMERPAELPLSYAQRRLWFLHLMEGPNPTYNIPMALRLHGEVDVEALQMALEDLVGRHESLRTILATTRERPRQMILDAGTARPRLKLEETTAAEVGARLEETARYCFDLEAEIPLRAWLFQLSEREQVLLLLIHHIAGDGWSLAPLARDLGRAYDARIEGKAPEWAGLPAQYADYTLWQREALGEEADPESLMAQQLRYWRQTLAGLPEELNIPKDRPRPALNSYRGERIHFQINAGLHEELLRIAREGQASLFMVIQAGVATLLTRLGAGTDIPLGSPIAGRTDDALDELVGFFVNTLVLRTDTSGNPSYRELLTRVREQDLGAYAHQDVPFECLVESLNPVRSLARHPLFQVMLVLQNNSEPSFEFMGLTTVAESVVSRTANFDLTFALTEQRGRKGEARGLQLEIEDASDLFDGQTVGRIAVWLARFLEAIATDPDRPIGLIDFLTSEERQQILQEWNATARPVRQATLPELFETQVESSPEAIAVTFIDQHLTYRELNRRANQLGWSLRRLGVGPEALVGLCLERSLELVIGLLGILKAGGAYLPLDPAYPTKRLGQMLEDSAPAVVLTDSASRSVLTGLADGRPIIDLAADHECWVDQFGWNPEAAQVGLTPERLAYVIFTSGSTGMPKGAMNQHQGIVNRIIWMQDAYQLDSRDAVLQKTPISFDVSVWEFFWPLIVGARLVLAQAEGHKDPAYLSQIIRQQQITTLHFVPAMLRVFLEYGEHTACSSLTRVVCSGESLPASLVTRFHECL